MGENPDFLVEKQQTLSEHVIERFKRRRVRSQAHEVRAVAVTDVLERCNMLR